jgi:hypothetical protein
MKEVIGIASVIIASFGGSGLILAGISSWLGKIWASRILEKEKSNHSKELEDYKNKLDEKIRVLNSVIDKSLYVTKLQYEKELSIYPDIWEKLAKCVISTKNLYPIFEHVPKGEEEYEKFINDKWSSFVTDYNDFSNIIIKYSPFYEENLYNRFVEIRDCCMKQGNTFSLFSKDRTIPPEVHGEVYIYFPKKIGELQDLARNEIRNYLKDLQAI